MPATKKSKVDLAQELGIVDDEPAPEVSSHVQKILNRQKRDRTQALQDWRELVEAQIAKEYIPDNLIQETFNAINDNPRLYDGYTALLEDAKTCKHIAGEAIQGIRSARTIRPRAWDRPTWLQN